MTRRFQRKIEDFVCGHCGARSAGNGYTNHCPRCLWSKHVDINPGDRENPCGGLMEPVGLELQKGEYHIIHKCQKCGARARCKNAPDDNINALAKLSETLARKMLF